MVSPCLITVLFTGKAEPADVPTNATPAATKVAIKTLRMRFSPPLPNLPPVAGGSTIGLSAIDAWAQKPSMATPTLFHLALVLKPERIGRLP